MSGYLRRLATTGAAYTASSVISKLIAVALLPLYTRYLTPDDYGAAEVMFAAVVAASIVIRLGMIEALLRFYYKATRTRRGSSPAPSPALFWSRRSAPRRAAARRAALRAAARRTGPELARIAIGGLWVLTMYEFLLALFRLDERARAFFVSTILNVLVDDRGDGRAGRGAGRGRAGLLLGSYATGAVFLLGLIVTAAPPARAASPTWPCCAGCCASACRRCRPSSRSTRSTSSTGS